MVSFVVIVCVVVEVIEPCVKLGTTGTAYKGAALATPIAYTICIPLLNIVISRLLIQLRTDQLLWFHFHHQLQLEHVLM